jgi:hypothetical protein
MMTFHSQLMGILDDNPSGTLSFEWVDGRMVADLYVGTKHFLGVGSTAEEALEELARDIDEADSK